MVSAPPVIPDATIPEPAPALAAVPVPAPERVGTVPVPAPPTAPPLDGRQIFFLFVGTAVAACLIFALGVTVGRRIEQRAVARERAAAAVDPLAALDEIANAEEALTFQRAVLDRPGGEHGGAAAAAEHSVRYSLFSPSFAQRQAAEEVLHRLRETGYKVKVVEMTAAGQHPAYRLQIGDFGSSESTQPIRSELLSRFGLATTASRVPAGNSQSE